MSLSSLQALQTILEHILNKPSMMEDDGELTKIKYTLLLKHNMSDISKMWWWMPLISTGPETYSIQLTFSQCIMLVSTFWCPSDSCRNSTGIQSFFSLYKVIFWDTFTQDNFFFLSYNLVTICIIVFISSDKQLIPYADNLMNSFRSKHIKLMSM